MNSTFRRLGPSELLPRYIFAESLFARRRVLELGAVASTGGRSAQFLSMRGARSVLACDPDLAAVEEAQKTLGGANLRFRANVFDDLETGSFDLALIADLAEYVRAPELLREIRRLLDDGGFLLGGLRNPAGLALSQLIEPEGSDAPATYGQLLDVLSPHFRHIEVATQSPVLGYQVAFERGDGLQVDGTLASAGEAAYFVVIAGQEPCRIFDPTWVQLPPEPLAYMGSRVEEYAQRAHELADRSGRLKQALEKARGELSVRCSELSQTQGQLDQAREESARLWAELQTLKSIAPGNDERDELAARVRRLESELRATKEEVEKAEARSIRGREQLELSQQAKGETESKLLAAQESARLERARREELAKLLEDSGSRLAKARDEVRAAQDETAAVRLELQRNRVAQTESDGELASREAELHRARERELKLADELSRASAGTEKIKAELEAATAFGESMRSQLSLTQAELEAALRASATDSEALRLAREAAEQERERRVALTQGFDRAAAEAELASALAEVGRLSRELEAANASEQRLKKLTEELESRLAEARDQFLIEQLQQQLEEERARSRRLEQDVSTAVAAERSTREQFEMALVEAQSKVQQLIAEREEQRSRMEELDSSLRKSMDQLALELGRAEEKATRADRALESLRADAQLVADRATEREDRVAELSGRLRETEDRVAELNGRLAEGEQEKTALQEQLGATMAEHSAVCGQLEARLEELRREHHKLSFAFASAEEAAESLREELGGEHARLEEAEEQARGAQAAAASLAEELEELRGRLEGAGAEARILEDDRARLSTQIERLEAERAWMAEKVEAAEAERDSIQQLMAGANDREAELTTAIADREGKLEILHRRLAAQDSELVALRRSLSRTPSTQVQQIYERATAELSAVKAGLFRRGSEASRPSPVPAPSGGPTGLPGAAPSPNPAAISRKARPADASQLPPSPALAAPATRSTASNEPSPPAAVPGESAGGELVQVRGTDPKKS